MTAVIGILNKHAAAIAADSAVSVGGPTNTKIFNRANKIFRLSKNHPVGLMIWNHGNFMGIPWEVVVKFFRQQLGTKSFPTVEGYKNEFINFLKVTKPFKDTGESKVQVKNFVLDAIIDFIRITGSKVAQLPLSDPNEYIEEFKRVFKQALEEIIQSLKNETDVHEDFIGFDKSQFDQLGALGLQQNIQEILNNNGLAIDISEFMPLIRELAIYLIRSKKIDKRFSGLVFVGFGEDEIFPSLYSTKVSLLIDDKLRWKDDAKSVINHENKSAIMPFAQTDVINTVLSGIDPLISDLYLKNLQKFLVKNNRTISDLIKNDNPDLARRIDGINTDQLLQAFISGVQKEQRKRYIAPMMSTIINLSKEDLAEMAESLVYLTYLKRRFTSAEESVGGPVDVAIITKGDGFVWIKRKHYFGDDLNHHFFKNY